MELGGGQRGSQSPRGRGRYSTCWCVHRRQPTPSLNPLAVGVGIQPILSTTLTVLLSLNPLAVGVGIQPPFGGLGAGTPCLNPLAVGVGIQRDFRGRAYTTCESQSPRGRGRYSTPS